MPVLLSPAAFPPTTTVVASRAVAGAVADALPIFLDTALKGAVLVATAAVVAWLLRGRSAAARHATWTAAVLAHLALPVLTVTVPGWRLPIFPAPPWVALSGAAPAPQPPAHASSELRPAGGLTDPRNAPGAASSPAARQTPGPRAGPAAAPVPAGTAALPNATAAALPRVPWRPLAAGAALWTAGALLVLLRLAVGTWRVARLARAGARVDDGAWLALTQRVAARLGVRRPLTLLRGDRLGVPVTWGVVYPAVLLPPDADTWPEERRRFVLVHELAHVRRCDALTQLLAQCTLALFWFDPLVWLAADRMRVEREHACDDVVLGDGTPPSHYAGELLDFVRALRTPARDQAAPAFAALAMARRSEFEGRMLAILDPALDRRSLTRRGTLMTALAVALFAVPLAALRPFQVPQPAPALPLVTTASTAVVRTADGPTMRTTTVTRESAMRGNDSLARTWPAPPASPTPPQPPATPNTVGTPNVAATLATPPTSATPTTATRRTSGTPSCDDPALSAHFRGTYLQVSDRGGATRVLEYVASVPGRCAAATVTGAVTFAPDDRDVAALAPGAVAYFRERAGGADRAVRVTQVPNGGAQHDAFVDGRPAPYDEAARAWLAGFLPDVLREAGINVPARVARLRAAGGVGAVLADVARIQSSGAKRAHYEALLEQGRLSADDVERIARQAGRDVPASGDLRAVLERLPVRAAATASARMAVGEAVARIPASGDRTAALVALVPAADRDLLLSLAEAARGIDANGDRAQFLRTAAPRYLTPKDDALRTAYFAVAATVSASGDLRGVLVDALAYGDRNPAVTTAVLETAPKVDGSGDRAAVLLAAAQRKLLTTPDTRAAYLRAAHTIQSSEDARRVLEALLPP